MKHRLFALILITILSLMLVECSRSAYKAPMKSYVGIQIPDGEYLQYQDLIGGDKHAEYYIVTKIVTNDQGKIYFKMFMSIITFPNKMIIPVNYEDWQVKLLFDPLQPAVIETEGHLTTNDMNAYANFGLNGIVYWHFLFNKKTGYVDYISKSINNDTESTRHYRIRVKSDFPLFEMMTVGFFDVRFLDPQSKGFAYVVMPDFMKEPLQYTIKYNGKHCYNKGRNFFSKQIHFYYG